MAEMVDMKMPKKSKPEMEKECCVGPSAAQDRWPYGLQIRFEKEQIDKLPSLVEYKVGDKVSVTAEGTVTAIRMSERQGGDPDHTVEIQLEKVGCEPAVKKPLNEMNPKEYRKARMGK